MLSRINPAAASMISACRTNFGDVDGIGKIPHRDSILTNLLQAQLLDGKDKRIPRSNHECLNVFTAGLRCPEANRQPSGLPGL